MVDVGAELAAGVLKVLLAEVQDHLERLTGGRFEAQTLADLEEGVPFTSCFSKAFRVHSEQPEPLICGEAWWHSPLPHLAAPP